MNLLVEDKIHEKEIKKCWNRELALTNICTNEVRKPFVRDRSRWEAFFI